MLTYYHVSVDIVHFLSAAILLCTVDLTVLWCVQRIMLLFSSCSWIFLTQSMYGLLYSFLSSFGIFLTNHAAVSLSCSFCFLLGFSKQTWQLVVVSLTVFFKDQDRQLYVLLYHVLAFFASGSCVKLNSVGVLVSHVVSFAAA